MQDSRGNDALTHVAHSKSFLGPLVTCTLLLASCVAPQMYTPDGYLSQYGVKQISAERDEIMQSCNSQFDRLQESYYDCIRNLIPLAVRFGDEYAGIMSDAIYGGRNIALGYEAGEISSEKATNVLDQIATDFAFQEKLWGEQYTKVVQARNAREKALAHQRMGEALMQAGSNMTTESYSDGVDTMTCRETAPGTVSCTSF
ncbi:MAG: hypothetical protein ACRDGA_13775 [Bacteroidota bacterium]